MNETRRHPRLSGYDYSRNGAYFVTVCTAGRMQTLSRICRGDPCGRPRIDLLPLGKLAETAFSRVADLYGVTFDGYVIMPNHVHFVLVLPEARATARVAPTVGRVVGAYKSIVANEWRKMWERQGKRAGTVWQRGYYEHVVRCEADFLDILRYMEENPAKWLEDPYYKS